MWTAGASVGTVRGRGAPRRGPGDCDERENVPVVTAALTIWLAGILCRCRGAGTVVGTALEQRRLK